MPLTQKAAATASRVALQAPPSKHASTAGSTLWTAQKGSRVVLQQPAQQQQQWVSLAPQQQQHQHASLRELQDALPAWAGRYRRQLQALPQGEAELTQLLAAVDGLLVKASHCGPHSRVLQAYLSLGLLDLVAQAWEQRTAELRAQAAAAVSAGRASVAHNTRRPLLDASLALAGCRYLRLEAASELGRQLHILLDGEGHSPALDLASLPAPHALGLPVRQLLARGLGVDVGNGASPGASPTSSLLASQDHDMHNLSWDEYATASADASMCGDWQFSYWLGGATWVPAPFPKFSTPQLVALLTPAAVLSSLPNCIWGRALVNAAQEYGLSLKVAGSAASAARRAGSGSGSTAAATAAAAAGVKHLLGESSMVVPARGVRARVRQFSAAVAQVRTALVEARAEAGGSS